MIVHSLSSLFLKKEIIVWIIICFLQGREPFQRNHKNNSLCYYQRMNFEKEAADWVAVIAIIVEEVY